MSFQFLDNSNNAGLAIVGDDTEIQDIFASGVGTIMGRMFVDGYGDSGFGRIADKAIWRLQVDSGNTALRFGHDFATTDGVFRSATASVPLNTWLHFAMTWDPSGNPIFYIDGVVSATTVISTPVGAITTDVGSRLIVGNRLSDYARQFFGSIANLRFYDRILSAGEVLTAHTANGGDSIITGLLRRLPMSPLSDGIGPNTAYRYVTNNTGVTASLTINVPTQHVDGDLLVLVVGDGADTSGTAPNINTPTNWTQRLHFDLPVAASRPAVAVFTKIAGTPVTEPASYSVTSDQGSTPKAAYMYTCPGVTSEVPSASATNTGTDASVEAPSITPTDVNSLVLRIACVDDSANIPTPRADFYPTDLAAGRRVQGIQGGGSNGIVLSVGEHHHDDTATGTQTFNSATTDEWGSASLSWTLSRSTGIEGLPAKDISLHAAHAPVQERGIIGGADQLKIGGC